MGKLPGAGDFLKPPLRYCGLGYCLAECLDYFVFGSFNWWRWVDLSITVAGVYVVGHVVITIAETMDPMQTLHVIVWQWLASVMMPTMIVFHMTRCIYHGLRMLDDFFPVHHNARGFVCCVCGLLITAGITQPVDALADSICAFIGL